MTDHEALPDRIRPLIDAALAVCDGWAEPNLAEKVRWLDEELQALGVRDEADAEETEEGVCRTCGAEYSIYGDGWDGECPSCADRTYAEECPSNHWNDGTDICTDCGADLHRADPNPAKEEDDAA